MRRRYGMSVSVAYPGKLGGPIPDPPPGYGWLLDDAGNILTDDNGVKIAAPFGGMEIIPKNTFPPPPDGFLYLTNDAGTILTDELGNWLLVPEAVDA